MWKMKSIGKLSTVLIVLKMQWFPYFLTRNAQPELILALPPVGVAKIWEQLLQTTWEVAWEKTTEIWKQPEHLTS